MINNKSIRLELLDQALAEKKILHISASGTSMLPLIFPGDKLTISKCSAEEIRVNDVILYRLKRRFIVHRVTKKLLDTAGQISWITKGDARKKEDQPVESSQLIAKVIKVESSLKSKISYFLHLKFLAPLDSIYYRILRYYRKLPDTTLYQTLRPIKLLLFGKTPVLGNFFDMTTRTLGKNPRYLSNPFYLRQTFFLKKPYINVDIRLLPESQMDDDFLRLWNMDACIPKIQSIDELKTLVSKNIRVKRMHIWGGYKDSKLIGFIILSVRQQGKLASIELICVDPDWRRKGVGSQLLWKARCAMYKNHCQPLKICGDLLFFNGVSYLHHEPAIHLFLKNGFIIHRRTTTCFMSNELGKKIELTQQSPIPSIKYVPFEKRHLNELLSIIPRIKLRSAYLKYLETTLSDADCGVLLAVNGTQIEGYVFFEKNKNAIFSSPHLKETADRSIGSDKKNQFIISNLFIRERMRGIGVGKNLMLECLNYLTKKYGPTNVFLESAVFDFHKKIGFQKLWSNLYFTDAATPPSS